MATITTVFPDVEALLAQSPGDLAPIVLRIARERCGPTLIHIAGVTEGIDGQLHDSSSGYPQNKKDDAHRAIAEAWNWLKLRGIIYPEAGSNGQNGHHCISREGEELLSSEANFDQFRRAAAFPKTLLHPAIREDVWRKLARTDLDGAVFDAFRAVEIAVREAGGYDAADVGVKLMRKAFGKGGLLEDSRSPDGEREALVALFAGAIGTFKNPHSHRAVNIKDAADAHERVMLASQLLRIVDSRRLV